MCIKLQKQCFCPQEPSSSSNYSFRTHYSQATILLSYKVHHNCVPISFLDSSIVTECEVGTYVQEYCALTLVGSAFPFPFPSPLPPPPFPLPLPHPPFPSSPPSFPRVFTELKCAYRRVDLSKVNFSDFRLLYKSTAQSLHKYRTISNS